MAIPTKMADLFLVSATDSPQGSDTIGTSLSGYLRALSSILRSTYSLSTTSLASASTVDLASVDGEYVTVTGSVAISSLGTGYAGCKREVGFTGTPTIQYSGAIQLPGGANITPAPSDILTFRCAGPNSWFLASGSRSNDPLKANAANAALTGVPTTNGIEIGYRGIPQTVRNTTYTLATGDRGQCAVKNDANPYTYTVPAAVFAAGDALTVLNVGSAGAVTLTGSGLTLQLLGGTTTGNRTIAPGGYATLIFDSSTHCCVGGPGVT